MCRRVALLLAIVLCVPSIAPCVWVSAILVTFSNTGVEYVFSANREDIYSSTGDRYTIEKDLYVGYTCDIELYHHNYTGTTKRFGVALYNHNGSSATIIVHARVINDSSIGEYNELQMTAPLVENYVLGAGSTAITTPACGYAYLMYRDVSHNMLVNGKAKVTANRDGVLIRVFHGPQNVSPGTVFTYTRDTQHDPNLTTATVGNAANKRLKITPNWAGGAPAADVVFWTPTYGWLMSDAP